MKDGLMQSNMACRNLLDSCGQLIVLSVLWIVGCVPIVTVGTSTAALYYAVMKSVRRGRGTPWKEFFRSYRQNLCRGILVTVSAGAIAALLLLNLWLLSFSEGHRLLRYGNMVLLAVIAGCCAYVCPILSRFSVSFKRSWKLALWMSIRFLPYTVLILGGVWLAGLAQFYLIPIPGVLLLPGLVCLGVSFPCERALHSVMPKKNNTDTDWYYE